MSISPSRWIATEALVAAATHFPQMPLAELPLETLSGTDAGLAVAIYRTTVQRWLTLEYLLDRASRRPMRKTDPVVRAVLLGGACQLLFMGGVADYAAVDEAVELVRKLGRDRAAGLVNAVLRKVSAMKGEEVDEVWSPGRDVLPMLSGGMLPGEMLLGVGAGGTHPRRGWALGGTLKLSSPMLPKTDNLLQHLAVATSHPVEVLGGWQKQLGQKAMVDLCLHNLRNPPTMVHDGAGGCAVWSGSHAELKDYLAADRRRYVADPTSAAVVAAVAGQSPRRILDYCAGVGTKTRQLALLFPQAAVTATDISDRRRAVLLQVAEGFENVRVVEPCEAAGRYDLILLDVPCSNSGVLARRAEARYRLTKQSVADLVAIQQQIIEQAAAWLSPGGVLLYATCSLEAAENTQQVQWICQTFSATIDKELFTLPGEEGGYHDGGYYAVLRWAGDRGQ